MSRASDDFAARIPQTAPPKFYLDAALLDMVLAEIASPPPGASAGWRHPRRRRIVEASAAYAPTDAAQAMLVARIISARLLAEETGRQSAAPDVTGEQPGVQRRTMGQLMHEADRLELVLRRAQRRTAQGDAAPATDRFDLLAENAAYRSEVIQRENANALRARADSPAPGVPRGTAMTELGAGGKARARQNHRSTPAAGAAP